MIIYIFDLDDTLLYKYYKNYSDIKPDIKLNNLLNMYMIIYIFI